MPHDMTKEMSIPPETQGLEVSLMPAPAHVSSQRGAMMSSHVGQALILSNSEFPTWFSGFESRIGKYAFRSAGIKEQCVVQRVIPKYTQLRNASPSVLVICTGLSSGLIHCFTIERYVHASKKFGYKTKWTNTDKLCPGTILEPGTEFEHAENHDGEMYNMGINANVVYMTRNETADDAVAISQSFADRLTFTRVGKLSITIDSNSVPLNLYGEQNEYKIFPDIGEIVAPHGIIVGIRKIVPDCFIGDLSDSSLQKAQPTNDELYRVPAGAVVTDVDAYLGTEFGKTDIGNTTYEQLVRYNQQMMQYHTKIIETYCELLEQGFKPSHAFNTLAYKTFCMVSIESRHHGRVQFNQVTTRHMNKWFNEKDRRNLSLANRKTPVPFIQIDITYTYLDKVGPGSKLTGRDGSKGVISCILPNDQMPTDEHGVRADVIACPTGAFNRLNLDQFYEQYICRVAEEVRRTALGITNPKQAVDYIIEFFRLLSPTYAAIVRETVRTPHQQEQFLVELETDNIHFVIPPFTKNLLIDLIPVLRDKYGVESSRLTFNVIAEDGTVKRITTKNKFMIGKRYIYVLYKIPKDELMAQTAAFVSQHRIPMRMTSALKDAQPIGTTPIRIGEDETCLLAMSLGSPLVARIMGIYANSAPAFLELAKQLLSERHPTTINRLEGMPFQEIIRTAANISMIRHSLGALGIDISSEPKQP